MGLCPKSGAERRGLARFAEVTRDLVTVRPNVHAIVVMYRGRVVERGPKQQVLSPPHDDYTDLLLKSLPAMQVGWLENVLATRRMAAAGH